MSFFPETTNMKTTRSNPLVFAYRSAEGHMSDEEVRAALEEWKKWCSVQRCSGLHQGIMARLVYSSLMMKLQKITKQDYSVKNWLVELVSKFDGAITEMRGRGAAETLEVSENMSYEQWNDRIPKLAYKDKYWNDLRTRDDIATSETEFLQNKLFGITGEPALKVAEQILIEEGWTVREEEVKDSEGRIRRDFAKPNGGVFDRYPELAALKSRQSNEPKGVGKKGPSRFEREIAFMFNMYDNRSQYAGEPPARRAELSRKDSGLSVDFEKDPLFMAACAFYETLRRTEKPPYALTMGGKKKFRRWVHAASLDDDSSGRAPIETVVSADDDRTSELKQGKPDDRACEGEESSQEYEPSTRAEKNAAIPPGHLASLEDAQDEDADDAQDSPSSERGTDSVDGTGSLDKYLTPGDQRDEIQDAVLKAFIDGLDFRMAIFWLAGMSNVNVTDATLCKFCGCGKSRVSALRKVFISSILDNRHLKWAIRNRDRQFLSEVTNRCKELIRERPDGADCLEWLEREYSVVADGIRREEEERRANYERTPRRGFQK